MPLSIIDPNVALVVIDLQKGLSAFPGFSEVVGRTAELASAFRSRDLPVVLVNVAGMARGRTDAGSSLPAGFTPPAGWTDIVDELEPQASDIRVTKMQIGAFHETGLDAALRERGVTQVVLAGVATSMGVESTARAAHEHGYHVVLAVDAMGDGDDRAHANSVERVFPRIGEVCESREVVRALSVGVAG
jgi:nicotinamidase-related amidase